MRNLFRYWDRLKKQLADKYIMLFLDYDGTLTPIVETPDKALISQEAKHLLERLSKSPRCKLAIISGRSLKDIRSMVNLKNIIYSGNHGLQIQGPRIKFESPISLRCKAILKQIKNDLTSKLSLVKGAILENKGLSLSVHYRLVDKKQIPKVKTIVHETAIPYRNKIKIKTGKMVFEIRPPLEWDKGKVVLWLLARQKFAAKEKGFMPIYIGDDITDEDAFKGLRKRGLTIFVGRPKQTYAEYFLRDTQGVKEFLKRILELCTNS